MPLALLGGDCSKLVSLDDVKASTAVSSMTLVPTPPLYYSYELPLPQAGGLDCEWADSAHAADLDVSVLPNSRSALRAETARLEASDDSKDGAHVANVPRYGDESWTHCISLGEGPSDGCTFDIRVGGFWIEVNQVYGELFTAYPQPAGVSMMLTHLVKKVRALPPVRAWKPDTDGLTLPTSCASTLPLATVRSTTGLVTLTQHENAQTFNPLLDGAFLSTGSLYCQWFTPQYQTPFTLAMIPGSAWAWTASTGPPVPSTLPALTPQPGIGTAAFGNCETNSYATTCRLFVLANSTWFELSLTSAGQPVAMPQVTSLATAVLTRIGFHS